MRYQIFVILLATFALSLWVGLANSDKRLFELGLVESKTPLDLCRLVHKGHMLQLESLTTKLLFLTILYLVGFAASIAFAILQYRTFQHMDDQSTMKDFVALVTGLPKLRGQDPQEDILRDLLSDETGEQLLGVSVCWDYHEQEGKVMAVLEAISVEREAALAPPTSEGAASDGEAAPPPSDASGGTGAPPPTEPPQQQAEAGRPAQEGPPAEGQEPPPTEEEAAPVRPRKAFGALDDVFLDPGLEAEQVEFLKGGEEAVASLVREMESTTYAFAVFKTETARDCAVAVLEGKGGCKYLDATVKMKKLDAEPDTVRWVDFNIHDSELPKRTFFGALAVFGALCFLSVSLFLPNMWYQLSYSFADEQSIPSGSSSYIMMIVVFVGNQFLFFVCGMVSERIRYHFEDDREAAYMVFYTVSMAIGVVLDMLVTSIVAYRMMEANNAHTYGGKLVKDLTSVQDIYEAFPIQKALGKQLFEYCWPVTFLGGYIGELGLVVGPYHFQKLILRSYVGIVGPRAERTMAAWMIMDTGRYADVLVNLILAVLIFFVPAGYYAWTWGALIGSHIYIYLYDHWRILRCVPGFCYASRTIDNCAQRMLAIPLGILLACLCQKVNRRNCNLDNAWFCLDGDMVTMVCIDAFVLHVCFHWAVLALVVPRFKKDTLRSEFSFEELAECMPATWFSTNPVHCLRSRSFYKHEPPCSYYARGKEHLMEKNVKANSFFTDRMAESEWK